MHEKINSVVHVHDHATTWGQFFENLGWYIGPDFIKTADGTLYREQDNAKLNLIINGQDYTGLQAITNTLIEDESRLLISFGDIPAKTLDEQYKTVASTAAKYDHAQDPASCAGSHKVTPKDRFQHLF